MSLESVEDSVAPLLGPEWGAPVLPSLANADVNFFVAERRAVPASGGACTLSAIVKSQSLVDAVGSSLIPSWRAQSATF